MSDNYDGSVDRFIPSSTTISTHVALALALVVRLSAALQTIIEFCPSPSLEL